MGFFSYGKFLRRALTLHTTRKPAANSKPGTIPAKNRAPIDALDTSEYSISGIDGGMRMSMVEAAAMVAPQKARVYPTLICHGTRTPPSAVASATAEPDTPPNSVDPNTLTLSLIHISEPTRLGM